MSVADRVLDGLGDALRRRGGPGLVELVNGLTGEADPADQLVQPTPGGWAQAFDVNTTPQPGWLGRTAGTDVPAGLTVEQERAYITGQPGWRRGTRGALIAAVQTLLIGTRHVEVTERDGSPWQLHVSVYALQYPSRDLQVLRAVATTQKPIGIVLTVSINEGATFAHMAAEHGPTLADYAGQFPTLEAARLHQPEEGTQA